MRIPMFFFAVCLALVPAAALAQDTTVELGWVALKLKQIFGLEIEARHRVALQSALANGANRGLAEIQKHASGTDVDVRSAVLAEGLRYVEKSVPDALKFFRLQPNDVVDHLEAHLAARPK
mgnify:CR=1 FL=1